MAERDENWYRLRNIWYGVVHRTTRQTHSEYKNYGGRGIKLCDRWHSFDSFYEDMRDGYMVGLSIGRIDNDGPYAPENCQWETKKQHANNRRNSRYFDIGGVRKTLSQWIDASEASSSLVRQRLYCLGWSIEESLSGKRN